ncbi:MAG: tetratricopeptide repeat protein [Verrucomicrobiae bacterium]|nr:tetratricopeptide repeat protein [Verrucomicrobiae bacterium]
MNFFKNFLLQKKALASLVLIVAIGIGVTIFKREKSSEQHKSRAAEYFAEGRYEEAEIEYMSARRIDPSDMEVIRQLGLIWFKQGALDEALPFLGAAANDEPSNLELKLSLAKVWTGLGFPEEAGKLIEEVLRAEPANGEAMVMLVDIARSPEQLEACRRRLDEGGTSSAQHYLARAMLAAKEGDTAGATRQGQEAIKLAPDYGEARMLLAAIAFQKGDSITGEQELLKASEMASDRSPVRLQYARYLMRVGRQDEARKNLLPVVAQFPDLIPARMLLAEAAAAEGDYDDALGQLDVVSRRAQNFGVELLKGRIQLASGAAEKAVEILESLRRKVPNHPTVNYWLASAMLERERTAEATEALQRALKANPSFAEADILLARLNLRSGDTVAVISAMRALLERRPSNLEAESLLFDALRQDGDFTAAEQLVEKRMIREPNDHRNRLLMGMVRMGQGRYEEARNEYEAGLAMTSSEDEKRNIRYLLTQVGVQEGNLDSSLEDIQKSIEAAPDDFTGYLNKARVLQAQEKWGEAEKAFLETIGRAKGNPGPSLELVGLFKRIGKYQEAVDHLENLLAHDGDGKLNENPSIHGELGFIYYALNQIDKSRDAYEKAIELQPENPSVRNNLAWLYAFRLNDFDAALVQAKKARELRPNDALVADTLGWIHLKSGDPQSARPLLEEAVENLPDNAEIQFHLGGLYFVLGLPGSARTAFQRAHDLGGGDPQLKEEVAAKLALLDMLGDSPETLDLATLEQLAADHGSEPILLQLIGAAAAREGKWDRAKEAYTSAVVASPQLYGAIIGLAELFAGSSPLVNLEEAQKLAARARELNAFDWRPAAVQGRVALKQGDFQAAYQMLQESAVRATDPSVLFDFAWAQYGKGEVSAARDTMQRAIDMNQKTVAAATEKGGVTFDQQGAERFLAFTIKEKPSADVVERAIAAETNYVPALMWQALDATADGAEATYRSVLGIYPEFTPAKLKLAGLLTRRVGEDAENEKVLVEAEQLARAALAGLVGSEEAAKVLGMILSLKGDHAAAIRLLGGIRDAELIDGRLHFYLGNSAAAEGDTKKAIDALTSAVASGLPPAMADAAKALLATLEAKDS